MTGETVYRYSIENRFKDDPFWYCEACRAWVGCHKGTKRPLGYPADDTVRFWRKEAHKIFDELWRAKVRQQGASFQEARDAAYAWLSQVMAITPAECHIGMMDEAQCRLVIEKSRPYYDKLRERGRLSRGGGRMR